MDEQFFIVDVNGQRVGDGYKSENAAFQAAILVAAVGRGNRFKITDSAGIVKGEVG